MKRDVKIIQLMIGTSSIRLFPASTNRTNNGDEEIGESFIYEQCKLLIEEGGITEEPVNLPLLASLRGVNRIQEEHMKEAGKLIPVEGGKLHISLRSSDSRERKNFSLGHEITHTFFPDYKLKPHMRAEKNIGEYDSKNRVECLCDFGASHLLMPDKLFGPKFAQTGFSIAGLKALAETFHASLEATGMKIVAESPEEYAFVVWEEKFKPSEKYASTMPILFEEYRPQKKLRVKFGFGFQNMGHLAAEKSLEESTSIIQAAFNRDKFQKGKAEINFGNFSVKCEIEAIPSHFQNRKRVLSVLRRV